MKLFYFSIILFFSIFINAQNPTFDWAKNLGSPNINTSSTSGNSIAVDNSGNIYTTGHFSGVTDFDPGVGTYNLSSPYGHVYVSKLNASGGFLWAKKLYPGYFYNNLPSIKTDASGNVYLAYRDSITKLSSSGSIVWAKYIGPLGFNPHFTIDVIGNILLCGQFSGLVDFNSGSGIDTIRAKGISISDAFILKLDNNGDFIWVKSIGSVNIYSVSVGSNKHCNATSIAVGPTGNVFVTGEFGNVVDFNPSSTTYTLGDVFSSDKRLFLLNLDASGNFVWAKNSIGGTVYDVHSMIIDNNTIYITGSFEGTVGFDGVSATNGLSTPLFSISAFLVKYDINGNYIGGRQMGGYVNGSHTSGVSVNIDAAGNTYVMGQFNGTISVGWINVLISTAGSNSSVSDIFISKYDNIGNCVWAGSFGNGFIYFDSKCEMVNDATGNIYIVGAYSGLCDFDMGTSTFTMAPQPGNTDAFILKLGNTVIGVEELSKNNSLIVFPNPNNGVVTIKTSSEGSYQLINSLGQTIKIFQLNSENNFTTTINELPQGLYTLIGKEKNHAVSQKIIAIE